MNSTKVRTTLLVIYVLAVLGFSASAKATMEQFPIVKDVSAPQAQMKTLVGEIAMTVDGQVYLVVSDKVFYELRSSSEDLSVFNGQQVQVHGYEMMHRVGPVYQLSSFNPSDDGDKVAQSPAPVLIVLQINELQ